MHKTVNYLLAGSGASFAIAIFHLVVIFIGAPAYRYFGAGEEMARLDESGSWFPALVTLAIVIVLTGFGFFGLSGSGRIRRFRFLRTILIGIGSIYTLRGLSLISDIWLIIHSPSHPARTLVFSTVSLAIGFLYLRGVHQRWKGLSQIVE